MRTRAPASLLAITLVTAAALVTAAGGAPSTAITTAGTPAVTALRSFLAQR
jgi:hypothetical protein